MKSMTDEELAREMRLVMPSLSAKVAAIDRIRRLREDNERLRLKNADLIKKFAGSRIVLELKNTNLKYEQARELLGEAETHDMHVGCRWIERIRAFLDGEDKP